MQTQLATNPLQQHFKQQQDAYAKQPYPSSNQRKAWLKQLLVQLQQHESEFCQTISQDFSHRSIDETRIAEIIPSMSAIKYCIKHLEQWMQPSSKRVGLLFQPAKAYVLPQPLGVVGIIVPWNYPIYLAIGTLCQALAAGNRVMIKMSEFTPQFSQCFQAMITNCFPSDLVHVVTGDTDIAQAFSQLPFNHLLFTGSTAVGKHVMRAASEHLTPVTLELGGKSPALIAQDADFDEAIQRIAFGKTMNAGQTCVAPDYVLVHVSQEQQFIEKYLLALQQFYPEIEKNPDYTAIINQKQLDRLEHYLEDAKQHGAIIHTMAGKTSGRKLAHCVIQSPNANMTVMQEEIFGPILPVIGYSHIDEAIAYINQGTRPLALYYFGFNSTQQQYVLQHTHSGGVCFNETLMHVAQEDLPFGGVGASGMGSYHGVEGFKTFSHEKSVFVRPKLSFMKMIYPPYGQWLQKKLFKLYFKKP
ncbi:coniferyl aldehyde dehydrogenase [Acinetobacter rathckeae]|uniref:coniferyl aldehyde dehydrogenase n=1 Tax=Acinetobacter rathckeae TaxID=2605272 RepID=UPI0018A29DBC|nr:coniferyl aldehyde dehydrogenase [Acinetobacter rathckeae]MBF7687246.1 coniferyl aldehyde dehydrogenase [Acinetobacter rathckeae]MBF7694401.1 coniferyl aldehyde dehydrogenase [Acinetobacter rathckeae]